MSSNGQDVLDRLLSWAAPFAEAHVPPFDIPGEMSSLEGNQSVQQFGDEFQAMQMYLTAQQKLRESAGPLAAWSPENVLIPHGLMDMMAWSQMSSADKAKWLELYKQQQKQQQASQGPSANGAAKPGAQVGPSLVTAAGAVNDSDPVHKPFDAPVHITQTFDPRNGEYGQDYAMPVGTKIRSPFGGTARIFVGSFGKGTKPVRVVYVDMVDASGKYAGSFAVGHMSSFQVKNGDVISPGMLLGLSGGDPSDPFGGESSGPHVEMQYINAQGEYVNPGGLFDSIFKGTTYGDLARSGYQFQSGTPGFPSGTGGPASTVYTSDFQSITPQQPEFRYFQMLEAAWRQQYGVAPPLWAVKVAQENGLQNEYQVTDLVNSLPSDINGMTNGQRADFEQLVQNAANKHLGYPVPASFLAQLAQQGITDPTGIDLYFQSHPAASIPKEDVAIIQQAAQAHHQSDGDYLTPDQVAAVHKQTTDPVPAWQTPKGGPQ